MVYVLGGINMTEVIYRTSVDEKEKTYIADTILTKDESIHTIKEVCGHRGEIDLVSLSYTKSVLPDMDAFCQQLYINIYVNHMDSSAIGFVTIAEMEQLVRNEIGEQSPLKVKDIILHMINQCMLHEIFHSDKGEYVFLMV